MKKSSVSKSTYFAAANGYDGFRSNFNRVFPPATLKRLYILKGGPGTGKSTLMRNISKCIPREIELTEILCSSDTGSLDGILLNYNGVTVAVADGTDPHAIEARYPGAVEKIINLGDGFDYKALAREKDGIVELSRKKKEFYKKGYEALRCAGEIHKYIDAFLFEYDAYKEAENIAEEICKNEESREKREIFKGLLVSAFSKDGHTYLPIEGGGKTVVRIKGDGFFEYLVTAKIAKKLEENGCAEKIFTSPFSDKMIDAVETQDAIYTVSPDNDWDVDISSLIKDSEEYKTVKESHRIMINTAQKAFKEAASRHFELEDIYTSNMSFEKNKCQEEEIVKEIAELFDK